MSPSSIVELHTIRKVYGAVIAVEGVSLSVQRGEFVSLLGPSGSGKTTTLGMIAGLMQPTSGTISLEGRDVTPLPPYRRNIGMVFQNYALFPHMTIERNIAFPLVMRKMDRADIKARVAKVLRAVGLPDHGNRYPRQLSGGQQQRVALARAIVFEPPLLLMDEPLGALDKKLRERMQLEIKRLHHELGMTIIYVTHDQEEALVMSDRIAVFNEGRLEQVGSAAELYDHPRSVFVADFIGESNMIEGRAEPASDGFCAIAAAGMRLRAAAPVALASGAPAALSVRPERIQVLPAARVAEGENALHGTVREVIYLGSSRKYVIRVGAGADFVARQQSGYPGDHVFEKGDAVGIRWSALDATALPLKRT